MPEQPKYRLIVDDLRRSIESGEIAPGRQLPTEPELMKRYGSSRNTIRDAIKRLTARWLVETRAGQGTFVTKRIRPFVTTLTGDPATAGGGEGVNFTKEVEARGRRPAIADPEVKMEKATQKVADELRIALGAKVVRRNQSREIDGFPASLQTSYYPWTLVERGADKLTDPVDIAEGTVGYLSRKLGLKQAGYKDTISVRPPNDDETLFFKLPEDGRIPVYEIRRECFDPKGERFRLTVTISPVDRVQYIVEVGEDPAPAATSTKTSSSDVSGHDPGGQGETARDA
jgi:GntR family transcriptional regulator